jgi:hypothetical protein
MARGADVGLQGLEAGFPVKKKPLDLSDKGHAYINGGTVVYSFWTNFSRKNNRDYEILEEDPKIPGYWGFITNLSPDDFDFIMSEAAKTQFMYKMVDLYRQPEA